MTRSQIFTKAHEIARATKAIVGDYRIAFSIALKDIYAGRFEMEEKTTAQKLEDLGIELWERGEMKRYYINEDQYEAVFGLYIDRYKTGNICASYLNDEPISHSKAGKLIGCKKIYFDATDCKWYEKCGMDRPRALCEELAENLRV